MAQELAAAAQVEAQHQDNLTVRELLDTVLKGKLGRLSVSTYDNARTTYARFLAWQGERRAAQPVRLVTRAALAAAYAGGGYQWARERYPWDQAQGGDAATWVLPRLRVHSNPSPEFTQLVRLHGIGLRGEKGAGNRRVWHSKTFHSLRATVVTMLHANGVSQGMAMELVGHDSSEVHAVYLRPTADQLRETAERLQLPA